jgi:3-phenylpropionate/cinnamic acid dioxygenase small subunit
MTDFADVWAIQQVYIRYCELIDTKDFDRLTEVFTADTHHDYSQAYGPGIEFTGFSFLLERLHRRLGAGSNCGATHHNVDNFRIVVNGNTAKAKVNFYAVHRGIQQLEGALYSMWGVYDDDLVRTPQGWRIADRRYLVNLTEGPVVTSAPGDPP